MKPQPLYRVRSAIYAQPWMITPEWLEAICDMFEKHEAADKTVWEGEPGASKIGYEVQSGVAVVPLMGPIFPRANMLTRMSGATSAESFRMNFSNAIDDKDVSAVIVKIDSPGGAVVGAFESASKVFSARSSGKPILAFAEGLMASAAYLIGSQADAVYATEASIVGSIGVVSVVETNDREKANKGIETTVFSTGPLKGIGNKDLTPQQKAEYQSSVDHYFGMFRGSLAKARPSMDMEAVAGAGTTSGKVWIGSKAQDAGLIDGITTLEDLISEVASEVSA